jgi:hypothetical protein
VTASEACSAAFSADESEHGIKLVIVLSGGNVASAVVLTAASARENQVIEVSTAQNIN